MTKIGTVRDCMIYTLDGILPGKATLIKDGMYQVETDNGAYCARVREDVVDRKLANKDVIYFC